jgi:predicted dehydrogenase
MQDTSILTASVGALPDDSESLTAAVMNAPRYELVGFCTEGLDAEPEYTPAPAYQDFHVMLEDPKIELVIVEGDLERRKDYAIRALNAGRHVLCALPFAETAADGVRIMKTALAKDLVATSFLAWRNDLDFRAALNAVESDGLRPLQQLMISRHAPSGLWQDSLLCVMDQANLLVRTDFASVAVHGGDEAMLYMPLRDDNVVIGRIGPSEGLNIPAFAFSAYHGRGHVSEGIASVSGESDSRTYESASAIDFWENLADTIQGRAEVACHPVDIVRAMRLQEAAQEAEATGRAGTV